MFEECSTAATRIDLTADVVEFGVALESLVAYWLSRVASTRALSRAREVRW